MSINYMKLMQYTKFMNDDDLDYVKLLDPKETDTSDSNIDVEKILVS